METTANCTCVNKCLYSQVNYNANGSLECCWKKRKRSGNWKRETFSLDTGWKSLVCFWYFVYNCHDLSVLTARLRYVVVKVVFCQWMFLPRWLDYVNRFFGFCLTDCVTLLSVVSRLVLVNVTINGTPAILEGEEKKGDVWVLQRTRLLVSVEAALSCSGKGEGVSLSPGSQKENVQPGSLPRQIDAAAGA